MSNICFRNGKRRNGCKFVFFWFMCPGLEMKWLVQVHRPSKCMVFVFFANKSLPGSGNKYTQTILTLIRKGGMLPRISDARSRQSTLWLEPFPCLFSIKSKHAQGGWAICFQLAQSPHWLTGRTLWTQRTYRIRGIFSPISGWQER